MVESLFNIVRHQFLTVQILTEFDVRQMADFYHLLLGHFNSMDLSLESLRSLHLSSALVIARTAVKINELHRNSQDYKLVRDSNYPGYILDQLNHILSYLDSIYDSSRPKYRLELSHFTLWSDFIAPVGRSSDHLLTISSTPSLIIRKLLATRVVSPKLYNLLTTKTSCLVNECQRVDDLIHSFVRARFKCICVFGQVRLELLELMSTLRRQSMTHGVPRASRLSPSAQFSIARAECERGLRHIISLAFQDRSEWMSPEDPISSYFVDPAIYYP